MKKFFTTLTLATLSILFLIPLAQASQTLEFEDSDPFISLAMDKNEVSPAEELKFIITYGNRGPRPAENVKVTLNQPMGGRAPLEFVSSQPQPDNWLASQYGNLPEFFITLLETYEATEEGKITITARVRESAAPQTLTTTVSLQAPKREIGKRLVVSNTASTKIRGADDSFTRKEETEADATESALSVKLIEDKLPEEEVPKPESASEVKARLLSSEAVWATVLFLGFSALLILAFIAGRKSQAG